MFDIQIIKLTTGSYLHTMPEKALAKAEKYEQNKYLQSCLYNRCAFTHLV